jgi:hypothetical protein
MSTENQIELSPDQKASELVEYYFRMVNGSNYKEKLYNSRMCAIKTVNEILEALPGRVIRNREWIDNPDLYKWSKVRDHLSQMKTL